MDKFEYSYMAPTEEERKEIQSIRRDYMPKEVRQSNLERLRELDRKVKNTPKILSVMSGIIGTLIFGLGLCMALEWNLLAWGIVVGMVGCIPIGLAYPLYKRVLDYLKGKYGNRILELTNELLGEDAQK